MMDESKLLEILKDWSFWDHSPPDTIDRDINLPTTLDPKITYVIQGVRRCGKSTLAIQFIKKYKLNKKNCIFVNFEDPRLANILNYELLEQVFHLFRKIRSTKDPLFYFFDEIQNVKLWEKWIHSKVERSTNEHFIITGSNSIMLSGELSTSLTGRHFTIELFPFDFKEFQLSKTNDPNYDSYLTLGGFPQALVQDKPNFLLREYFNDIVEKDIRERTRSRSTQSIRQLIKIVYESCGSEISLRKLAGSAGLSADTVSMFLNAAENAYLLFSCPYFAFSEKQRIKRNKKYYPVDMGLRNAIITKTGLDLGKSLETHVFLRLRKISNTIYYWRNKGEVDFVVQDEKGITPYQVSYDGIKDRHEKALEEFYGYFPQANEAIFITKETVLSLF